MVNQGNYKLNIYCVYRCIFIVLLCVTSTHVKAEAPTGEIVERCKASMAKYGAAMVKSCADTDIEAYNSLQPFVENEGGIYSRCEDSLLKFGYSMILSCVESDITARDELNEYSSDHSAIIEACKKRMLKYGFSMVQACADQDIEAAEALKNY